LLLSAHRYPHLFGTHQAAANVSRQLPTLVKAMHGGIAERIAEEEARGPCPFINAKKSKKKVRRVCSLTTSADLWQTLTDGNSALAQDRELAEVAKNATPDEVAACPFLRGKQTAPSAANAAEVAGPADPAKAEDSAGVATDKPSGGTCPIPFHRELANPTLWIGLTALVIGTTIGLALRGVARPS
jgi:hypothetical protein